MEFSSVSLKIETVGEREALRALESLDAAGRRIVENVSGALGRSLGDVASAYDRVGEKGRDAFRAMSAGVDVAAMRTREAGGAVDELAAAHGRLGQRAATSSISIARAFETMERTGRTAGRSLDTLIAQTSQVAFSFGATGAIVGAVGIATAAIVELFERTSREAKKMADEVVKEFSRIAHMDVKGQGEAAALMYSGDPNATNELDKGGLQYARARKSALEATIAGGTITTAARGGVVKTLGDDAKKAADELAKVDEWLHRIEPIYASLYGVQGRGGSLGRAGAADAAGNLPGFISDKIKQDEERRKEQLRESQRIAREFVRLEKERRQEVKDMAGTLADEDDDTLSPIERLNRFARKSDRESGGPFKDLLGGLGDPAEIKKNLHETLALINATISKEIENNPIIQFEKAVKKLAEHMRESLGRILGESLAAGFEAAFTGKGITGAFEALTATVLAGLGSFMEQLGAQMIIVGISLEAFATAVKSLNGIGAIAAGIALVAAGAGLKAIAGSFGSGHSASGGGGYSSSTMAQIIDRGVINPGAYSSSAPSSARPSVTNNVTIIGPSDPQAQRAWDELQRRSLQRGSLVGAG